MKGRGRENHGGGQQEIRGVHQVGKIQRHFDHDGEPREIFPHESGLHPSSEPQHQLRQRDERLELLGKKH